MTSDQQQFPVIVLVDKESSGDMPEIREWFENSRFSMCEASNVFEALEQLSDFTIRTRPDVVLLDVNCCEDDMPLVRNVANLPTMAISGNSTGKYFDTRLGQMASQLDKLIPQ